MKRTKIVCTLGPTSNSPDTIGALIDAGADVFRLNFSHGSHDEHARAIRAIREQAARRSAPTAILQDLCGPKLRVGAIDGGAIQLDEGETVVISSPSASSTSSIPFIASTASTPSPKTIPIDFSDFAALLEVGARVLINDGLVRLEVVEIRDAHAVCRVVAGGAVSSRKGVNLPGAGAARIAALTDKDLADLKLGLAAGVDFVALSFVRQADDIRLLRRRMEEFGRVVPIIAKVEKAEAVAELDAIVAASDGVMVARGDLGIEVDLEDTPLIQKRLIRACNAAAKPVITATQMLESMMENPIPTRAEVSDVANAILDGSDAVMLSGETAVGRRPVETVATMARIAARADSALDARETPAIHDEPSGSAQSVAEAIGFAACRIAHELNAAGIVACTMSGSTARLIARYKPRAPIYAVTPNEETWRRLNLTWAVRPLLTAAHDNDEDLIQHSVAAARADLDRRAASSGDSSRPFVVTAGLPIRTPGITNLIRVVSL